MSGARDPGVLLGAGAVALLLRQRRPMLMVDFVTSFERVPVPTLTAGRHISANEIFFEGHFPGLPLWPAALTMEGLGQAAAILAVLSELTRPAGGAAAGTEASEGAGAAGVASSGVEPAEATDTAGGVQAVLESLRNLDRGYRFHPGYQPEAAARMLSRLRGGEVPLAVAASVDLKFLRPVFPGCRLDYRVKWTTTVGDLMRFSVEATVDAEPVARGTLTGGRINASLPPY